MQSLLIAALLIVTILAAPGHAQPLKFVADIDFAPYSMISENNAAGIDVEVISAAAKKAGYTIDLVFKPWEELVQMVKTGACDGAFSLFHSPEREKEALFMEAVPVHYSDYVLFTKVGDKFDFNTYDDLKGKTIGKVAGTNLGKEFEAALAAGTMTVKEYPDLATGLRGLLLDEINAYAGNIDVTYYQLKKMGMTSSIVYLPKKILSQKPAYLVMSRASQYPDKEVVLQKLGRALNLMRKDGSYNRIAKRYLFRF